MPDRSPIAFLSYVQEDDKHDGGRITHFRERLEGEVKMHMGKPFSIFQDRNDLLWGQHWKSRIASSLADTVFLIPIITPSFFVSPACREEFEAFRLREVTLGKNNLILPVYYLTSDELEAGYTIGQDEIADTLRSRQWTDWRRFRFKSNDDPDLLSELARLAVNVKTSVKELTDIIKVEHGGDQSPPLGTESPAVDEIHTESPTGPATTKLQRRSRIVVSQADLKIPEARIDIKTFSKKHFDLVTENSTYYTYTKRFDEVCTSVSLSNDADLPGLQKYLSSRIDEVRLHESEVIIQLEHYVRQLADAAPIHTTLLLDNSGSMRGEKALSACLWTTILAESLSKASVSYEILGFTTRAWKGGATREQWVKDGKPEQPGRLNDLRHIIYKDITEGSSLLIQNMSVMLREGLLKENIDGEALLWTYGRLPERPRLHRIVLVISDGAPVDDSTMSVNSTSFLMSHARRVAKWVGSRPQTYLYAVSFAANKSQIYSGMETLSINTELGAPLGEALSIITSKIRSTSVAK